MKNIKVKGLNSLPKNIVDQFEAMNIKEFGPPITFTGSFHIESENCW